MTMTDETHGGEPSRRRFIHIFATVTAAAGAGATLWPLVHQMNPDASVLALSTVEVDLSAIAEGQAIKVMWQGRPVFIRHRTPAEIEQEERTPIAALKDALARNDNIQDDAEASDANRRADPKWMIVTGICTHLGCVPLGTTQGESRGDYNGWFCPCHGSHYDVAGRIRRGPAPENLEVPRYEFLSDTRVKIG